MERSKYIDRVLQDHLLDQKVYRQLGPGELDFRIKAARQKLIQILGKAEHEKILSEYDTTYFRRALQDCNRIPQLFCRPKIHKIPWKLRPVTGSGGSLMSATSKWVDRKLQPLTKHIPTFVQDWNAILNRLKKLNQLPSWSLLLSIDANSMYTNIDTDH